LPFRDYTNPDELVSLSAETDFQTAIDILSNFSKQFSGRIIINNAPKKGAIGMNIPTMPWRQALEYIVRANNLRLLTHPDYFEIVPPEVKNNAGESVENITLDTREVKISATFFEGNRRLLREIGVDWSLVKDGIITIGNQGAQHVSEEFPFLAESELQKIANTGWQVQSLFKVFEASNQGDILASPTIKVIEGHEGRIQVGQDFSIKQRDFAGNVIETFFSTGTISQVTPTVIKVNDTSFIHLTINAEKSSAQPDPVSTIINKNQATTQVLLADGEETVIGGLYSTDETTVRRGVPVLKDLPWWFFGLRYIFGYESADISERELVVLMQAEIVPTIRERLKGKIKSTEQQLRERRLEKHQIEEFKPEG
jgi:type IV pilus assembly protein PilQ